MFCVTTSAIKGLAPHPLDTQDAGEQQENRGYLTNWLKRLLESQLITVNS